MSAEVVILLMAVSFGGFFGWCLRDMQAVRTETARIKREMKEERAQALPAHSPGDGEG